MIKGSLRLILGEWKDTTSIQQAACAALLLALLLLPGCSELALPSEEMPAAGADPSYVNIVAHHLKTLFKNQASYDAFEISPFRWVHSLKGWAWLTCVRFQDQGHPRVYSVFLKDGRVVDGRYAVVTGGDDTLAASGTRATGMVYVIDLRTRNIAAQVTGVGIDPYGVTVIEDAE